MEAFKEGEQIGVVHVMEAPGHPGRMAAIAVVATVLSDGKTAQFTTNGVPSVVQLEEGRAFRNLDDAAAAAQRIARTL